MSVSDLPADVSTPQEVLAFWLGAYPLDEATMLGVQKQWFQKVARFDQQIRQRFGATLVAALAGQLQAWAQDAEGRLALILVLDQFTRNAFRGQAASFAGDPQALALALEGLERGDDARLPPMARPFVYLPLEHAEDLAMQQRAVQLFDALPAQAEGEVAQSLAKNADYAHRHLAVIQRFGRFPHRNAILGRTSTQEELDYLAQPGAGF